MRETLVLQASVTKTASFNGADVSVPGNATMMIVFLNVSAASGTTPTLDVTIQGKDPTSSAYVQIGVLAQLTGTGTKVVTISPGGVTNNNNMLPHTIRAVATIGGTSPSFTYTVTAVVA